MEYPSPATPAVEVTSVNVPSRLLRKRRLEKDGLVFGRDGCAVGDIDIRPAVVVVIEDGNTGNHGFNLVFFTESAIVDDHGEFAGLEVNCQRGGFSAF